MIDATPSKTVSKTVELTQSAIVKAIELFERENDSNLFLRIQVNPGGCSGLRYAFFFDNKKLNGDVEEKFYLGDKFLTVKVDKFSSPYLVGASIDFVDTIDKQGFTIDNPNAGNSCSCGDSFS